jgi:hypothetical protein
MRPLRALRNLRENLQEQLEKYEKQIEDINRIESLFNDTCSEYSYTENTSEHLRELKILAILNIIAIEIEQSCLQRKYKTHLYNSVKEYLFTHTNIQE